MSTGEHTERNDALHLDVSSKDRMLFRLQYWFWVFPGNLGNHKIFVSIHRQIVGEGINCHFQATVVCLFQP